MAVAVFVTVVVIVVTLVQVLHRGRGSWWTVEHDVSGELLQGETLAQTCLGEDVLYLFPGEAMVRDCIRGRVVCLFFLTT